MTATPAQRSDPIPTPASASAPAPAPGFAELATTLRQTIGGAGYIAWHALARRDPLMRLFTPAGRRHRYAIFEELRPRGPVSRSTAGMLSVVDHRMADALLRRRDTTVTDRGNSGLGVVDLSLLITDPPDHTRLRALVAPAFTPRRMREQEERIATAIDALADRLVDQLADGPVDLVAAYAKPLPVLMITSLLGIPDAEVDALAGWGDAIGRSLDGVQSMSQRRQLVEADHQLRALMERLIEQRRRQPGDDVISHLVAAEDAERLTHAELVPLAILLLVAGFETTVNLLGNAVSALLERPDLWRRLTDDPDLAERAIDETLRYDPPVQFLGRTATADMDVEGHPFRAGDIVVMLVGAVNRDPQLFERPLEFSLDRPRPREHLAFGSGIHHCVGRPLAELEGRLALAALARRLPRLRRAGHESLHQGVTLNGRRTLPVRS
ncbi:MAG: cytochrome P450 [Actinomycetes bacterium]